MDTDSYIQLITIIILLFLSAFFSSAETSFMTVSKMKIRSLMDEGNKRAALVAKIIDDSGKLLSAVLIGNNIVNISCSALVTTFTIKVWGSYATGIATGVLTLFVLLFGEITPKNLATYYSVKLTLLYAPIIYGLMVILTPVIFIVDHLAGGVLRIFGIKSNDKNSTITEEELRTIVKVSHEEGIIEKDERQIIDNLFDFGDTSVKDVMIPRIDMTVADVNSSYEDIITLFKSTMYTRIPIYENDSDNVIGILNIKDLIVGDKKDETFNIRDIMRKPFFTYEHKNTSELFKEMQLNRYSIAIVLDEYGQIAGDGMDVVKAVWVLKRSGNANDTGFQAILQHLDDIGVVLFAQQQPRLQPFPDGDDAQRLEKSAPLQFVQNIVLKLRDKRHSRFPVQRFKQRPPVSGRTKKNTLPRRQLYIRLPAHFFLVG